MTIPNILSTLHDESKFLSPVYSNKLNLQTKI